MFYCVKFNGCLLNFRQAVFFTWVGYQSPARNPKLEDSLNTPLPFNEEFCLLGYNTVYSVISQKLEIFITTALGSSNSTLYIKFLEAFPETENEGLKQSALS
jgi:hypothetical protein